MRLGYAVLISALAGGVAHADMGSLPDSSTITFNRLFLNEVANPATNGGTTGAEPLKTPDSLWRYFDYAHCVCDEPGTRNVPSTDPNVQDPNKHETTFAYELLLSATTLQDLHFPMEIWVGNQQCDMPGAQMQTMFCTSEGSISDTSTLSPSGSSPPIHIFDLMNPGLDPTTGKPRTTCVQDASTTMGQEWLVAQTMGGGVPDFSLTKQIAIDTFPPPLPVNMRASSGDGAINLSWDMPTGDTSDIYNYQALCANEDGTPALGSPSDGPLYLTPRTLCGDPQDITWTPFDVAARRVRAFATDAAVDAPPDAPPDAGGLTDAGMPMSTPPIDGIAKLDPAYICHTSTDATATSMRITGLQNGKNYYVALVVNDKFLNSQGVFSTGTISPIPSTDFWEDLHDRGSNVEGGFCLLNETYGRDSGINNGLRAFRDDDLAASAAGRALIRAYYATLGKLGIYVHGSLVLRFISLHLTAPLVVVALAWHLLTLPGLLGLIALAILLRRRRVLVLKLATAGAMLLLFTGRASAQPYWEHDEDSQEQEASLADEPSQVGWHAGIRLGEYVPGIDKQLGGSQPGPYLQMFGKGGVMTTLDVDKIVFHTMYGQIGFGGTFGYLHRSANTFTMDSNPTDANRARASDTNDFTLLPVAVTATFRVTYLDDEWGIPIVPFVRGGASYYIWWISGPDSLAQVCKGGGTEPKCDQNTADGASIGVQGEIGLAIRAERVQADAASAMRDGGIQHAGFVVEMQFAKVDGLWNDKKLSVGDTTLFGGVDFEF